MGKQRFATGRGDAKGKETRFQGERRIFQSGVLLFLCGFPRENGLRALCTTARGTSTPSRRWRLQLSAELDSAPLRTLERVLSGTTEGMSRPAEMPGGATSNLRQRPCKRPCPKLISAPATS